MRLATLQYSGYSYENSQHESAVPILCCANIKYRNTSHSLSVRSNAQFISSSHAQVSALPYHSNLQLPIKPTTGSQSQPRQNARHRFHRLSCSHRWPCLCSLPVPRLRTEMLYSIRCSLPWRQRPGVWYCHQCTVRPLPTVLPEQRQVHGLHFFSMVGLCLNEA